MINVTRHENEDGPKYGITGLDEKEFLAIRSVLAWAVSHKTVEKNPELEDTQIQLDFAANYIYNSWETESWDNETATHQGHYKDEVI